jgi:P-type Cu+ transporter
MKNFSFSIADMDCASCVRIIASKLKTLDGVKDVEIDLATKKVNVRVEDPGACESDLMCAVEALGYKVHPD